MSKKQSVISFFIVVALGVLGHFLFDLTKSNLIALFTPVNESIFEHLKLVFFPFIFIGIFRYFFNSKHQFLPSLLLSSLIGIITIPILFYFYTFFLKSNAIINIIIFVIACAAQEFMFYNLMNVNEENVIGKIESLITLFVITLVFITFTFYPPKLEIFQDPTNHTYGINEEK